MWEIIIILLFFIVLTGVIAYYIERRWRKSGKLVEPKKEIDDECCGAHEVCEKDRLLAVAGTPPTYFDDEELDRYAGRAAESYTDTEQAEFQEVFETLRESEVAEWVRSMQLRGIELPIFIRDEVLLVMGERRKRNRS